MGFLTEAELPRCTFDQPLELTPDEIGALASPVNLLLKSTYLLGSPRDIDSTFQSLFDIAEEIAGADRCAYLSGTVDSAEFEPVSSRSLIVDHDKRELLFAPADLTRHFGKVVMIESARTRELAPVCDAWQCPSLVAFPLRSNREFIGALVFGKRSGPFTAVQVKLLWYLAVQAECLILQTEAVKALSFYSFLDPLTHLYNRRYFDNQIEKEVFRSRRNAKPFSLLLLDLDGFKSYNDRFFHAAGDIALQEFATLLQDSVREVDTVARLGGDEFVVLLAESGPEGARDLALRLIDRLGKHQFPGIDNSRTERLSVSVGVATFPSDTFDKEDLFRKADRALYLAKGQGGGKVCLYHEISDLLSVKPSAEDVPIQKIYNAARSVVDMDKFLDILLFTAMQGLTAGRGSIVVTDPRGDVTLRAAIGFHNGESRFAPGSTIAPGEVTSLVMERKEPILVTGPSDMPLPRPMKKNGYRSDSFLAIPLLHEGALLGVLHLTNRKNRQPFTREDLTLFDPISKEIARILSQGMEFREKVRDFSTTILTSLAGALELRYSFLTGHAKRVRDLSVRIAGRLGFGAETIAALGTAADLHDIGIVGIPGAILSKRRKLNERELEIARKHPILGSKMLEGIPGMDETRRIILEHQEHIDGSGYPYGLKKDEISPGGRVLAVAEFYDSITSERPHRGGLRHAEAFQMVKNGADKLFDRDVCAAFVEELRSE